MEKQYQITLTESQCTALVNIILAVNENRRFQAGSNLRESHVCNIDQRDIDAMEFFIDQDNWTESDDPVEVKIGSEVEIDGHMYVCKEYVPDPESDNECDGCVFFDHHHCPNVACSCDDRRDKKSVLFVEKESQSE